MQKKLFLSIKIFFTLILTVYLIRAQGISRIYDTVAAGDIGSFLCACALIPLFILLKVIKWHAMARNSGTKEPFISSLRSVLIGLGFGLFTPGRAGEIIRIRYYPDVDKVMLGGLVVIDRIIDLITILLVSIYFFASRKLLVLTISIFIICIMSIFLMKYVLNLLCKLPSEPGAKRIHIFFRKIGAGSKVLTAENMSFYCGLSFIIWGVLIVQFWFIINSFYMTSFEVALATLPIIQLGNLIPITIAGLGVRENLSVLVMHLYNIPDTVAAMSAFCLFAIDIALTGIIGLILFGSDFGRRT